MPALRAAGRRGRIGHQRRSSRSRTDGAPLMGESPRRQGLLAGRGGVGHPRLRRRQGDGRVAGGRRLADGPPRVRRQPVRGPPAGARRTSTTAASRTTSRSTTSSIRSSRWRTRGRSGRRRSTSASRSWVRTSSRATAGSGRTGTGRTRGCWAATTIPRRNAWAERYWHPIAGAEALATRDDGRPVRHDLAQAARGDRAGRARLPRRAHDQPPGPAGRARSSTR